MKVLSAIAAIISAGVAILGSVFIELGAVASVIMAVLKLCGVITVGWLVVAAPFLIPLGLAVIGIILGAIFTALL